MAEKTSTNRMTEGSIAGALFRFTMPILLGNIFQQLYNTADALIVGNLLGSGALAAVTSVGSVVWLMISVFNGFAQGSGVLIARYFGAGDRESLKKAIHTHMVVCFIAGIVLMIAGSLLTPQLVNLLNTPENVIAQSQQYIRIFFLGGLGLTLYNGCTGLMHAVGDSRHPLYYLIFSSCLNVVLDVAFIKFFGMDVGGAALATIISQFLSAVLCLYRLFRTHDVYRLEMKSMRIDPGIMKQIFRYGLPASFQNAITALANTMVQANINAFGEMAMAGVGAFSKIEGFLFQPVISLSMALSTFTSQNLGGKKPERAKKGAKYGTITAMCIAQAMALMFMIFAEPFLGFFTPEAEAIAFGMQRLKVVGWFYFALAATHCLAGVMRGAGKAMIAMIAYAGFWCVLRVALLAVLVPVFQTINAVFSVFSITWCCSMIYLMIATFKGNWLTDFDK